MERTVQTQTGPAATRKARTARTPAQLGLIGALLVAAAGIGIQIATGVTEYPTIPPGAVLLVASAIFVAIAPWRWAPIVGLILALYLTIWSLIVGVTGGSLMWDRLATPSDIGPFLGTGIQLLAFFVAVATGAVATTHYFKYRK